MANVLVFAETRGGELRKVALEAVTAARALADASGGGEVHAVLAGAPGIGVEGRRSSAQHGADVVFVARARRRSRRTIPRRSRRRVAERAKSGGYRAVRLSALRAGQGPRAARRGEARRRRSRPTSRRSSVDGDAVVGEASREHRQGHRDAHAQRLAASCQRAARARITRDGSSAERDASRASQPAVDPSAARVVVTAESIAGRRRRSSTSATRRSSCAAVAAQGGGQLQARRGSRRRVRQRGRGRHARGDRRRLAPAQRSDRTDGPAGEPAPLRRGRHLRRDPASRRHAHVARRSSRSTRTRMRRSSRSRTTGSSATCSRSCRR